MANITLNIEGDLNIYVSEEDGQPDSLYLDGMDGVPETLRIHLEADGVSSGEGFSCWARHFPAGILFVFQGKMT